MQLWLGCVFFVVGYRLSVYKSTDPNIVGLRIKSDRLGCWDCGIMEGFSEGKNMGSHDLYRISISSSVWVAQLD
jgi:hypothetical protein